MLDSDYELRKTQVKQGQNVPELAKTSNWLAVVEDVRTLFATSDTGLRAALANITVLKATHEGRVEETA